ncbi:MULTISPECIES: TetR family transcriptional regulator [unclassified Virgibacillus]|uniref:TetR family transcriptional regulator n=1 Tax=unclassified Virgibacillus TaxID=2620237 RepID=UPI0024DE685D|nr:TetR family transcriptional regulator [Virgibacillus sp. LDC-1]
MENKKQRIIHAAMDVFCEKGIEKTKVSDIVKRAGIAQGTYYIYFSSKLAVMPSIAEIMVEKMLAEIKETVQQETHFLPKLKQVIDVAFSVTEKYREIFALIYAGLASTAYLQEWEAIYAPYYSWMSELLAAAKQEGVIRSNINPEQTAVLLIGLIESAAEQTFLYSQEDGKRVAQKKQVVLDFALHALGVTA